MIAAWMAWVGVVSLLLAGAAAAAEGALRRLDLPARGVWAAALVGSLALGALPWLPAAPRPGEAAATAAPASGAVVRLPDVALTPPPGLDRFDRPLLVAWGGAAAVGLLLLAGGAARLARLRRRWEAAAVDGHDVLVSDDFGPAVVGLWRPRVVLPRWVTALDADTRRLVLLHEEEHRRRGDVPLLVGATVAAALVPWNAALWWILGRLRGAVELDCDRRTLRRGAPPLPYAKLLLRVGSRGAGLLAPALAEPARTLERRLTMIVTTRTGRSRWSALALAGAAVLLVGLACETPAPSEVAGEADVGEAGSPDVASVTELGARPLVLVDGEPYEGSLDDLDRGAIERVEVLKGQAALDAHGEGGRDGVILVTTEAGDPVAREARRAIEALTGEPTFTPFTIAPDITNRSAVVAAMQREYPSLLREAGIGGTVRVHFLLDADGAVRELRLDESSGHPALDAAAMRVAASYRFTSAYDGDEPVPVWISLPISFRPNREERVVPGGR